jgi:hypothetical protein
MLPFVKEILCTRYHTEVTVMTTFLKQTANLPGMRLVQTVDEYEETRQATYLLAKFGWYALVIAEFLSQRFQIMRRDS